MTNYARFGCWVAILVALKWGTNVQADEAAQLPWESVAPEQLGMDRRLLDQARNYALTGGGSGIIVFRGKVVMAWGDLKKRYDLKSTTKSIGVTALGLALADGLVRLDDPAVQYHPSLAIPPPENQTTGWRERITLRHLATHTAGFAKPGGYGKILFEPGTQWLYSDAGPNWLAECLIRVYRRDMDELLFERVFFPIGISREDLTWRRNAYRDRLIDGIERREFGSGIQANVSAMARLGYLYLRYGNWDGKQLLPAEFIREASRPVNSVVGLPEAVTDYGNASDHYGLLWWNNADATLAQVPTDAYWSWGLYDSLIVVIPSLDLVIARAGDSWKRTSQANYDVLRPFLEPIVLSATGSGTTGLRGSGTPPYPYSTHIAGIRWNEPDTIVRRAAGSDNWPITWGDDGRLYTAFGDGRGFEPYVPEKLSLGVAVVTGGPESFHGENLRSPTIERRGDGPQGPKASGMLMVDGVLYMLVRNVENSQLVWSEDRAKSWHWCDWKFTTSFGCPTFLNFGRNYHGARDEYVYVFSPDTDSAYRAADRFVLARVPKDQLRVASAYEYFVCLNSMDEPVWTKDVRQRGAVFQSPGNCYRSGISFHVPSGRYLWYQVLPQSAHRQGSRFAGGMGVFDARQPWGPWTTVYYTQSWDVGLGESGCFPTAWMSQDGRTVHLVFSNNDSFAVRGGTLLRTNQP